MSLVIQLILSINRVCEWIQNYILGRNWDLLDFFIFLVAYLQVVGYLSISEVDSFVMAIITLDNFFDQYHLLKLFLFLNSFLVFIALELSVA